MYNKKNGITKEQIKEICEEVFLRKEPNSDRKIKAKVCFNTIEEVEAFMKYFNGLMEIEATKILNEKRDNA